MAAGPANSKDEKARAQGILDNVLSQRFIFWLHIMLDFFSAGLQDTSEDKYIILIEIPTIVDDCIDGLSDLAHTKGGDFHEVQCRPKPIWRIPIAWSTKDKRRHKYQLRRLGQ